MPITRSTEEMPGSGAETPTCSICANVISSSAYLYKSTCNHIFHKSCYHKFVKTNQTCPVCNSKLSVGSIPMTPPPPVVTRSQASKAQEILKEQVNPPLTVKSLTTKDPDHSLSMLSTSSLEDQREHIRNIVTAAVGAQQAEMLVTLNEQLTKIIEENIESGFRRLNLGQTRRADLIPEVVRCNTDSNAREQILPGGDQQTLDQLLGLPSNRGPPRNSSPSLDSNQNDGRSSPRYSSLVRPDKVGHIIHNWKIKFSGDHKSISVDNFIYRIEALTTQTLNGNFDILCRHISTLFESKAADWFWRYHRSVKEIRWQDLCVALRHQYKDSRTDVDFREMIRDRKQKLNETFDSFYEAIIEIADRLTNPLSESVLVEVLRRNLLPEIQHEILNIAIYSVSHLRDICRRREFFLMDIEKRQLINKPSISRRQVHELVEDEPEDAVTEELAAISLICWNCRKTGHRYQDCLEDRQVFCYGCGAVNTYKPNCTKCNESKNLRSSALKSAHKLMKSMSTSTE